MTCGKRWAQRPTLGLVHERKGQRSTVTKEGKGFHTYVSEKQGGNRGRPLLEFTKFVQHDDFPGARRRKKPHMASPFRIHPPLGI